MKPSAMVYDPNSVELRVGGVRAEPDGAVEATIEAPDMLVVRPGRAAVLQRALATVDAKQRAALQAFVSMNRATRRRILRDSKHAKHRWQR